MCIRDRNNEDILKEYQNHQITQKEYLKKQRKNNSNILKKDALNSFYLYYLKIKNTQHKDCLLYTSQIYAYKYGIL